MNELAQVVADAMGKKREVIHLDPRNEVKIAFSDHSRAEKVFGKRDKTSLETGIRAMAEWVKVHGARESSVFENIEIVEKLPKSWANVTRVRA